MTSRPVITAKRLVSRCWPSTISSRATRVFASAADLPGAGFRSGLPEQEVAHGPGPAPATAKRARRSRTAPRRSRTAPRRRPTTPSPSRRRSASPPRRSENRASRARCASARRAGPDPLLSLHTAPPGPRKAKPAPPAIHTDDAGGGGTVRGEAVFRSEFDVAVATPAVTSQRSAAHAASVRVSGVTPRGGDSTRNR